MEWSDKMVLEFLHYYENEPVIWDPKNVNHKKKYVVAEAWRRLKSNLSYEDSTTVEELKKKKDSLMAYYRIHLNKIRKSEMESEESYKTGWFAFSAMHRFLAPVYECSTMNTSCDTEEPVVIYVNNTDESNSEPSQSVRKKRRQGGISDIHIAEEQMDEAYSIIKKKGAARVNKPEKVDECYLYAQLLTEKLKKIDEDRRIILMHNIDTLVFQEIMAAKEEKAASAASGYLREKVENYLESSVCNSEDEN